MTHLELKAFCLSLPGVYEDYPFDDLSATANPIPVMRHGANKKMFALIGYHHERWMVLLKCNPMEALILRDTFQSVAPGYHMNKTHWNMVFLDGDVPDVEIHRQVTNSYHLTAPKKKRAPKAAQAKDEEG